MILATVLPLSIRIMVTDNNSMECTKMRIQTTVNMHRNTLDQLETASRQTSISRNKLIILLLQHSMKNHCSEMIMASAVRYQKRVDKNVCHRFHLIINEYEYEYFLDMRKLFKISVSLLIANMIKKYLSIIVQKILKKESTTDNYPYQNYIVIREHSHRSICWKLYWGLPQKIPIYPR